MPLDGDPTVEVLGVFFAKFHKIVVGDLSVNFSSTFESPSKGTEACLHVCT
jgi:hypothetical protein